MPNFLFLTFASYSISVFHSASSSFSSIELNALKDFYLSLDGDNWQWLLETDSYGIQWDINNVNSDPCADRWQGIHCTCLIGGLDAELFPYTGHSLHYSYVDYVESYSISGNEPVSINTSCFVRRLNLVQYGLKGTIPDSLADFEYLQAIQLSNNRISATINPFLWNLSHLESFVVGDNALTGLIPPFLDTATKNLTYLALANNKLEGTFPASLCNLSKLATFTLGFSSTIVGTLPSCIGLLTQLDAFSLVSTSMNGSIPPEICNWDQIRDFSIAHNSFTSFPSCFGQSGTLEHINIGSNNGFDGSLSDNNWCNNKNLTSFRAQTNKLTGYIPTCFGRQALPRLSFFNVSENLMSGTVGDDLWNITTLVIRNNLLNGTIPDIADFDIQNVDFSFNSFTGTIPGSVLCQWNLSVISGRHNLLTGSLPSNCSSFNNHGQWYMSQLYFDQNYLTGTIPEIICDWNMIFFFDVSFNYFSDTLPECIGNMANPIMKWMSFGTNTLRGTVPNAICDWTTLAYLNLQENAFTGSLPSCIGNLTSLYSVYLDTNELNGTLPISFCELKNVQYIQIYGNRFSGTIPTCIREWRDLQYIYLQRNKFTGLIDSFWCDLQSLRYFDARINFLRGTIPLCLWNLRELMLLELSVNQFTGPLFFPDYFCSNVSLHSLPYLQYFAVELNNFIGTIPSCLHEILPHVEVFDISSASLNGSIPNSFCLLYDLQILNLYENAFAGALPDCFSGQQSKLSQLNLWNNHFIGTIPPTFCALENLQSLQIAYNQFTGSIPQCLATQWQSMLFINASYNHIIGTLSERLCNMSQALQYLALSNNHLHGPIPVCFGNFNQLKYLFLSSNKLTGSLSFLRYGQGILQLKELLIDNNRLTGPIFEDLVNRTTSSVVGVNRSQLSVLLAQRNRFSGSLPNKSWQERYTLFNLSDVLGELITVDISENRFRGQVEPTFFESAPALNSFLLIKNCFSGDLSDEICLHGENLEVLALDGLSAGCKISNSLVYNKARRKAGHGAIPACLLNLPKLRTFHAAGNDFIGTLPSIIGENLTDLSLSNNNLRGTISASIQRKIWTNLDLAYNKLEGLLVDSSNISQWSVAGRAVKLNRNRLSGTIPSQYQSAQDVNMLDGNLFSCRSLQSINHQNLPRKDPNSDIYSCGTDSLDLMLFIGIALASFSILALWLWVSNAFKLCFKISSTPTASAAGNVLSTDEISLRSIEEQIQAIQQHVEHHHIVASKEDDDEGSYSSSEVRAEERVLEHKADDPHHPANRKLFTSTILEHKADDPHSHLAGFLHHTTSTSRNNGDVSSASGSPSFDFELAIFQLKKRLVGCVEVLRSDLLSFRTQQSVFRAAGNVRPTERLTRFLQVCDHQRRLFLAIGSLSLLVFLPINLLLSYFYKTHSLSYAWIISAAYDSGLIPAVVLLTLWFMVFVWLYHAIDPELRYRGRGVVMRKMFQRLYQVRAFWQEYSLVAVALLINALLILLINGAYVYIVVRNGRGVSIVLQCLLAVFKLLYNGRFVSKVIRGSEWLQRLRKRQALLRRGIPAAAFISDNSDSILDRSSRSGGESLLAEDESFIGDDGLIPGIYSEGVLVVFNFVVAPIIAASLADTNCFYSAIVSPPPLQTSLTIAFTTPFTSYENINAIINGVNVFTLDTIAAHNVLETNFEPQFVYSGQCVSSIIATYEPVFVLLYLAILFVLPIIMFLRRVYFKRSSNADNNEQSNVTSQLMTGEPRKAGVLRSLNFDRRSFVISRVTNLSVLLTFGWVFPPLAVLIALVEVRDSIFLVAALQQYIVEVGGMINAEKKLGWHLIGIPASLPNLQLRYMPLGAMFLGLLLFDIAADDSSVAVNRLGLISITWAPVLMFFGPWVVDQLRMIYTNRKNQCKTQRLAGAGIYIAADGAHDDAEVSSDEVRLEGEDD